MNRIKIIHLGQEPISLRGGSFGSISVLIFLAKKKPRNIRFQLKKLESKARGQFSRSWIFLFLLSPNYDSTIAAQDASPRKLLQISIFALFLTQILALVRKITGLEDTEAAVKQFKAKISSQDMYFNKEPFPANETGSDAFKRCSTIKGAMEFCPKRWEAFQMWLKASREVIKSETCSWINSDSFDSTLLFDNFFFIYCHPLLFAGNEFLGTKNNTHVLLHRSKANHAQLSRTTCP